MNTSKRLALIYLCISLVVSCGGTEGNSRNDSLPTSNQQPSQLTLQLNGSIPDHVTFSEKPQNLQWVSTATDQIVVSSSSSSDIQTITDSEFDDYKPVYSPDGSMIAFFRVFDYDDFNQSNWKTIICVVNSDGTGFRELTTADNTNWNPMWTRDGSNQIIFTRVEGRSPLRSSVYRVDPYSNVGDAIRISSANFNEFSYSGLQDGRILVRRWSTLNGFSYHFLTPHENDPTYQRFNLNTNTYIHKVSVSPSENKVAYMRVIGNGNVNVFQSSVIAYADIDTNTQTISNEKVITPFETNTAYWYPAWSSDENHIVYGYTENLPNIEAIGDIRAYNLETKKTSVLSSLPTLDYRYPNVIGVVK